MVSFSRPNCHQNAHKTAEQHGTLQIYRIARGLNLGPNATSSQDHVFTDHGMVTMAENSPYTLLSDKACIRLFFPDW